MIVVFRQIRNARIDGDLLYVQGVPRISLRRLLMKPVHYAAINVSISSLTTSQTRGNASASGSSFVTLSKTP